MTVTELHRALCDLIVRHPGIGKVPVHIENAEDDSKIDKVIIDDGDPWEELDDPPDGIARIVITATDGHRWANSAAGRKANSSARRAKLRDRKTAIKLIVAHVLASTTEPAAPFREIEKHVEELIDRYIAEKP